MARTHRRRGELGEFLTSSKRSTDRLTQVAWALIAIGLFIFWVLAIYALIRLF